MTPELAEFIAAQRSFFLATANLEGQPYVQHRGGPPGFLRVLDEQTLAFADFAGNRQYIIARQSPRRIRERICSSSTMPSDRA